jgi:hypothetical protein
MTAPYRVGNHNARNIYRYSFSEEQDVHIGVMFTPEDGRRAVGSLNLAHAMSEGKADPAPIRQYMVRAFEPGFAGDTVSCHDEGDALTMWYAFASDEEEAARAFHAQHPQAVIRDLWQLMPPGYLGVAGFTSDRDLCATPTDKGKETPW